MQLKSFVYMLILLTVFYNFSYSDIQNEAPLQASIKSDKVVFGYQKSIPLKLVVFNYGSDINLQISDEFRFLNYVVEVYTKEGYSVQERDSFFANRFDVLERIRKEKNTAKFAGLLNFVLRNHTMTGWQVDLNHMYSLAPGQYLVRFKFYPSSIIENPSGAIYSPYVQIIVQKSIEDIEKEQLQSLSMRDLQSKSVQDIINLYFQAQKDKNWPLFFQVLNLNKLISIFDEFGTNYQLAMDTEKVLIIKDFKKYLKDLRDSEKLLSYEIESVYIKKNEAITYVVVTTSINGLNVKREYKIKLAKKYFWQITSYNVIQK